MTIKTPFTCRSPSPQRTSAAAPQHPADKQRLPPLLPADQQAIGRSCPGAAPVSRAATNRFSNVQSHISLIPSKDRAHKLSVQP